MAQTFSIDTTAAKKLAKFARRMPRQYGRAYAMTLNNLAFAVKPNIAKAIDEKYEVRSKGFVNSSIRVDKAKARTNLAQIEAVVGSIRRPRFSGWEEPMTGKQPDDDTQPTMESRKGSTQRKVVSTYRFKNQNKFRKQSEFKGKSKYQRSIVMVNTLAREKYRKPFLISGHKRIKSGLYIFGNGNRLRMVQSTDPKRKAVKRYNWVDRSLSLTARSFSLQKAWERNINKVLPRKL